MSVAEKLRTLRTKINNNINAVVTRQVYTGGAVDVSEDILRIGGKHYGQNVTYLRKPYELNLITEVSGVHWTNLNNNTVLGNGNNPIELTNNPYPFGVRLKDKDGNVLYDLQTKTYTYTEYKDSIIRWTGLANEFNLYFGMTGDDDYTFNLKFSCGDFVPKNNCITEFIMEYSQEAVYRFKIYKIFARYMNP